MSTRRLAPAALTIAPAADYLGISRRTLERICAEQGEGKTGIPVVKLRGRRMFRVVDLDAYLEACLVRGTAS